MSMLEARGVSKVYETRGVETVALREVDLSIESGEFTALAGPSGSGKTTLLNLFGGLDAPTEGSYHLHGQDVSELSDSQLAHIRNKEIGFVFQTFNLLPRTTALRQVELPLMYAGMGLRERRKRSREALEAVGLGDRTGHRPDELSGGQQQRVAVARALVAGPSIIMADEPTGNLDTKSGEEVLRIFKQLNEREITIIFVTHDPEIAEYGGRTIHIRDGLIEKDVRMPNGCGDLARLGTEG